jgi:hypothetical protein
MFTKLKNKIAEEVKKSPLKLSASVQQLTQVCSLYLANVNLLSELTNIQVVFDCSAGECDNCVY